MEELTLMLLKLYHKIEKKGDIKGSNASKLILQNQYYHDTKTG
jgi:hypothetical protein